MAAACALLDGAAAIYERGDRAGATTVIAKDIVRDLHAKIGELMVADDFFVTKAHAVNEKRIRRLMRLIIVRRENSLYQ